ncbi:MAG: hypothetical protein AB7U82_08405 [Blastocatellales bacterium]
MIKHLLSGKLPACRRASAKWLLARKRPLTKPATSWQLAGHSFEGVAR